jgi:dynein heavy chain
VNDLPALFESKIELAGNHLAFSPSFEEEEETSLIQAIKDLLDDMYKVSTMVPRVAHASSAEAYLGQMSSSRDLEKLRTGILDQLRTVARECQAYRDTYDQYAYLWTEDRHEYMKQFLVIDDKKDQSGEGTVNRPTIPLDKFEAEIKKFESIHKTVMALDNEVNFKTWLRVDAKPLKQNLNVVIKKWSYTFTKYLSDDTVEILSELNRFVKNTKKGLENKVQEGDYDGLITAMALLLAVKHRASDIDTGFEPLRKTANLLKQCGVDLNEDSQRLLNDLPEEWSNVKKLASAVREHVSPLQSIEVEALQKKANKFEMKNHQFREDFKKNAPFRFEVGHIKAYDVLDQMHVEVGRMEAEATALRKSADLFELTLPVYKQLVDCRREIGQLKNVWDIIGLVTYLFDSWKTTLWTLIDIDAMDAKCRDLSKELRRLDKEMKAWDVYIGLDQMVKDMIISLRAVGELRSNAIRDRHWKQLMATTGVTFVITEDMKFQDLLRLQLHKFEDEVKGIVDRATKELGMEKILSELDATWKTMEFTFEPMEGGDISLIKASEELVETLEDNQVMLQNLMTSKYVAHFLEVISKWQSTLSTVDMILTLWREVQQTWSHLENIFKGSEDIRTQLPEDTKRFDIIDERYRALMKESVNVPNCIQLCMREGLYDLLENLQSQLALCEKSLAEYLETKRLAFPRFYFVSGSDLLDILAKGTMPQKVQVHLPKLFDNIARLEFQQSDGPEPSKVAVGMYSKEDEYVAFSAPVELNGPVEVWLNRLVDTMRKTLRTMLGDAVTTYEEKPRDQWIFDNAAQITLAGTQSTF